MNSPEMDTTAPVTEFSNTVSRLFAGIVAEIDSWRQKIETSYSDVPPGGFDELVEAFAILALNRPDSLLIGAGFIGEPAAIGADSVNFAWWLGPTAENPLFPRTTAPTRLDVATRSYTDYLTNFTSLEWYRVPAATRGAHITGPYVDYLCICDYVFTVTVPVHVDDRMIGVVGADLLVKRLEKELMPPMLALRQTAALVSDFGRVVLSTDIHLPVGALAHEADPNTRSVACPATPFRLLLRG